jgi:hypothetical protein
MLRRQLTVDSPPMDIARLGGLELQDASGTPRRVSAFWAERPVALVFLRHFG